VLRRGCRAARSRVIVSANPVPRPAHPLRRAGRSSPDEWATLVEDRAGPARGLRLQTPKDETAVWNRPTPRPATRDKKPTPKLSPPRPLKLLFGTNYPSSGPARPPPFQQKRPSDASNAAAAASRNLMTGLSFGPPRPLLLLPPILRERSAPRPRNEIAGHPESSCARG